MATESSKEAYEQLVASGLLGEMQLKVLLFLFLNQDKPHWITLGGISRQDIKDSMSDTTDSTVSRTAELEERGLVYVAGHKTNKKGNKVQVWRAYESFEPAEVAARVQAIKLAKQQQRQLKVNNAVNLDTAIDRLMSMVDKLKPTGSCHALAVEALAALQSVKL